MSNTFVLPESTCCRLTPCIASPAWESEDTMSFEQIDKAQWHTLFDQVSKQLIGRQVQTEVVGLDLGDEIEESWLTLDGLTYDSADDTLYVFAHDEQDRNLEHAILSPQQVYVEMTERGLTRVVAIDSADHKQFVSLREPLALPAA